MRLNLREQGFCHVYLKLIERNPSTFCRVCLVLLLLFSSPAGYSQEEEQLFKKIGFLDFNAYRNTRDLRVLTINLFSTLPHRFQYFSLTNYYNDQESPDLNFYTEHNLPWAIKENLPLDLTYQYVLRQGERNDDHRIGLRWRLHDTPYLKNFFS